MKTGIELIAEERKEQLTKHKRTIALDVKYNKNRQLRIMASILIGDTGFIQTPPEGWDKKIFKKMVSKKTKERLIIAGALIAAEIDRLQNS